MMFLHYKLLESTTELFFFNIVPNAWRIKARWLPFWVKLEELTELEIHYRAHGKHSQALKSWKDCLQFHWKRRKNITVKYLPNRASPEQFYYSFFSALVINKSVELLFSYTYSCKRQAGMIKNRGCFSIQEVSLQSQWVL